jgi:hypothetical protein
MDIGMLWFDDSSRTLKDKITRAVDYYKEKYGSAPTHCVVNPATLNGGEAVMAGVEVQAARSVLQHHFWIGVDETAMRVQASHRKAA